MYDNYSIVSSHSIQNGHRGWVQTVESYIAKIHSFAICWSNLESLLRFPISVSSSENWHNNIS